MFKAIVGSWLSLIGFTATVGLFLLSVLAHEPGEPKQLAEDPSAILGNWDNEVRHAVHGSLYQPTHGARLRPSVVHFELGRNGLVGFSLLPDHTLFRGVTFTKGQLSFEFDINELNHGWGNQTKSKARVRVEAELKGERLIGKWRMFEKDGSDERFRGEWEAVRAKHQTVGAVVLAGGGPLPDVGRDEFSLLAGGKDRARIVVIPTASATDMYTGKEEAILQPWARLGLEAARLLHTRDRKTANDPAFFKPLTQATGVWFTNGHTDRLLNAYQGTKLNEELKKLLARGGVVGGQDAGAVVLAERVHQRFDPDVLSPGYGLLPGIMMVRGFGDPGRTDRAILDRNPNYAGLGIPNGVGAIIRGQSLAVLGKGTVTVYRAKSATHPAFEVVIPVGGNYDLKTQKLPQ